jgi:3-oxoacyl-[acyl-carrier protein] reductase
VRILITGASRGLGLALARHLIDQQHHVVGCSRSSSSDLTSDRYEHLVADVTREEDVKRIMDTVRTRHGGLDVLINNAGWARMLPIALTPAETARRIMEANFLSTFMLTHAALRLLRRSDNGRIVNVSSIAVPLRLEGEAVYAAAKSAVEMFTRITAKEVGGWGITCNAIGPSPIRTRLIEGVPEAKLKVLIDGQAIREWAEPSDVINVVDFFLRPESRLVTGQIVYLGGYG